MKVTSLLALLILVSCSGAPAKPKNPMRSKDRHYQQCFEESDSFRNTNVKPRGQVSIVFTLMPNGKIEDEKIAASDFKDANFHACLLDITRQLELPGKKEPTRVTKQLNFSSKTKIYE